MQGKYKTVVIDFAWPVDGVSKQVASRMKLGKGARELPYKTMTIEQIKAFPINDFAANECALFLWTTQGFLELSLEVAKLWGFKLGRLLTWDKGNGITWLGFTNNAEFVVFAYRGKYPIIVESGKALKTAFRYPKGQHSEKPEEFYSKLLPFTPEPRIDIFARKRHFGFDGWGDQVQEAPLTIHDF